MAPSTWQQALFTPRGIALIGVTNDASRLSGGPLFYLRKHGYAGPVYPVNSRRESVQGERAYASLADIPGPVDHAYILLNTDDALDAVRNCIGARVRVATLLAGGFADAGPEGLEKQRQVAEAARAGGLRIVGPNSLGLVNFHNAMPLTATPALIRADMIPGRLMVISQSGSMMGTLISRGHARGIGFSKAISIGNESDLTVGEIGAAFADDPETEAFLLFIETIRDRAAMTRFAELAHRQGKPILAFKLGRSEAGRQMAVSHTGAIVGSDRAADAFLKHLGIVRVDHIETLFELPALIGRRGPPKRRGGAVGVVTTTGGGAALVVDRLGTLGVTVTPPSAAVLSALHTKDVVVQPGQVLDLTMAGTRYEAMRAAVETMQAAPENELVLTVTGNSAEFRGDLTVRPIIDATGDKPRAVFLAPNAEQSLKLLAEAGVPGFRTPESCADAIAAYLGWTGPGVRGEPLAPKLAATLRDGLGSADGTRNERQSLVAFATLGIATAESAVMEPDAEPPSIGYPVVAKILSPDVPHKTEAGGVALRIGSPEELRDAASRILARVRDYKADARIEGILVQRMETRGLIEVLLGYRRDPHVGPIVTLAMGGVLAEIHADAAVRMAPVTVAAATEMIQEVASLALIRGYRGLPRGDVAALAEAVAALSRLADLEEVAEAEINPLIVRHDGEGVVAVDGLIVLGGGDPA
nr:acetate--CoA ligase family protein [Neoroseomonas terrae]